MTRLSWILIFLMVSSCASIPKPIESNSIIDKPFPEIAALFERQLRKCWKREASSFEAGIDVSAKAVGNKGAIFTATRKGLVGDLLTGRTFEYAPFVRVELTSISVDATGINVTESVYCPAFKSCIDLNFRSHLNDWVQGNIECKKNNYNSTI